LASTERRIIARKRDTRKSRGDAACNTPAISSQGVIVEDEGLLAMEIESLLAELGCSVLGPVPSVDGALALLDQQRPEAAIVDVSLDGQTALPVVAALTAQGVPFVLTTGYTRVLQPELQGPPRVTSR
jgi:CheY-like chemotaxis protein